MSKDDVKWLERVANGSEKILDDYDDDASCGNLLWAIRRLADIVLNMNEGEA